MSQAALDQEDVQVAPEFVPNPLTKRPTQCFSMSGAAFSSTSLDKFDQRIVQCWRSYMVFRRRPSELPL
jgi:hypothetical protein